MFNLISVLGFIMIPDGKVLSFGKWVEEFDVTDRSQLHNASFEDDITNLLAFTSLNIPYDSREHIMLQASSFTRRGVVMFLNTTLDLDRGLQCLIFVPDSLMEGQINSFSRLYPDLFMFDDTFIYQHESLAFRTVDEFYQVFHIPFENSNNAVEKKTI